MNRLIPSDWRGQTDWNPELESGAPVQRLTPAVRPVDLLDEDIAVHRPTPTVQSIESFDAREDIGRYVPLSYEAVPVGEAGAGRSLAGTFDLAHDHGGGSHLYDPALDEFFIEARFGDSHAHGSVGTGSSAFLAVDDAVDDVIVTSATDAEALVDAFIALPQGEAFALPAGDSAEAFGVQGQEPTFGGGDDRVWMLTLLPSPDDHIHDTGFGHPGLGFDPWG